MKGKLKYNVGVYNEPDTLKWCLSHVTSKGSVEPAQLHSLIRACLTLRKTQGRKTGTFCRIHGFTNWFQSLLFANVLRYFFRDMAHL